MLIRSGLREVFAGDLEGRTDAESGEAYLHTVLSWPAGDLARRMPGGEDGSEVLSRFDSVVSEVASSSARSAVIVSHGAVIRVWSTTRAANLDAGFAAANPLSNTGMVVLEGDPAAGWRAVSWAGEAVGGPRLADAEDDGPAGKPVWSGAAGVDDRGF